MPPRTFSLIYKIKVWVCVIVYIYIGNTPCGVRAAKRKKVHVRLTTVSARRRKQKHHEYMYILYTLHERDSSDGNNRGEK